MSWELCKNKSTYHFDPSITDSADNIHFYIGNISANVNPDLTKLKTYYKSQSYDLRHNYSAYEIKDLTQYPLIEKIANYFQLIDSESKILIQMPKQMYTVHFDNAIWEKWHYTKPKNVIRISIILTPWELGQFVCYGNYIYHQWKAGDVTYFDWQNIPHGSVNLGFNPRITLQLTGIKSEITNNLLQNFTYEETLV